MMQGGVGVHLAHQPLPVRWHVPCIWPPLYVFHECGESDFPMFLVKLDHHWC